MPLLHAACDRLSPEALEAWSQDVRGQPWWDAARETLRTSAPVPLLRLLESLHDAASRHGVPVPRAFIDAAQALPAGVVRHLAGADGYITAGPQEVCLQLFGGLALAAALDRHSDTFRARVPEAMPIAAADPNPAPLDAPSPANAQRIEEAAASDFANFGDDVPPAVSGRVDAAPRRGHGAGAGRRGRRGGRGRGSAPEHEAPAPRTPRTVAETRVDAATAGVRLGLEMLDRVDLEAEFRRCVFTLQSAPTQLPGVLRLALRTGLQQAVEERSPEAVVRGWKLFFLAPRMLLYREPGQSRIEPRELQRRADAFSRGEWLTLLRDASQPLEASAGRARAPAHADVN